MPPHVRVSAPYKLRSRNTESIGNRVGRFRSELLATLGKENLGAIRPICDPTAISHFRFYV